MDLTQPILKSVGCLQIKYHAMPPTEGLKSFCTYVIFVNVQSYKVHETGNKQQAMGAGLACKKHSN
jgi:hypothetical protein